MAKDNLERVFEDLLSGTGAAISVARERVRTAILANPQPDDPALADIAAHLDSPPESGGDAAFIGKLADDPDALHEVESAEAFVDRVSREEQPVPATLLRLVGAAPAAQRVVRLAGMPSRRISLRRKPVLLWGGAIAATIIAGVTGFAIRGALDRGSAPLAYVPIGNPEQNAVAVLPVAPGDVVNNSAPPAYGVVNPPIPIGRHAVGAGDYPPESVQFQEQGTVKVKYLVLKNGTVDNCQVEIPSGFARLDDAACVLVRQWLFKPASVKGGSAVDWWLDATIVFQLRNGGLSPSPQPPTTALAAPPKSNGSGIATQNQALVKAIKDAQAAAKAQNWAAALEKAQEADSIKNDKPAALNPIIHEMIISYAINSRDFTTALVQLDKRIAAGEGNKLENLKQALSVAIMAKNKAKTDQYAKELGTNLDNETRLFIASTMMNSGQLKESLEYAKPALEGNASEAALKFEQAVYFKMNDQAGRRAALEQLVASYPKPEYWHDLLQLARNEKGLNDEQLMDIYRLRFAVGDLKTLDDYTDMAQEALVAGYPAEAKQVLDKAAAAKLLNGDRSARLVKLVNDRVAQDAAAQTDLQKKAGADPNSGVKLGLMYWSFGKNKEAEDAIRSAISRNNLADPDQANMALGHVLLSEGKFREAIAAFRAGQSSSTGAMIARLWVSYSRTSSAAAGASTVTSPPNPVTSHAVTADDYPPVSIRLEEQGKVAVKYLVKEDGNVSECAVVQSSGKTRLDDAACTMVKRRWTFKPATRNGKPVAEYLTAEIIFRLK